MVPVAWREESKKSAERLSRDERRPAGRSEARWISENSKIRSDVVMRIKEEAEKWCVGADRVAREWATGRALNLKPLANKGCLPLGTTELRVLLKIELSMMSPFSFFFFEFLHLLHFSVSRAVVSICFVWRVASCTLILLVCCTTLRKPES